MQTSAVVNFLCFMANSVTIGCHSLRIPNQHFRLDWNREKRDPKLKLVLLHSTLEKNILVSFVFVFSLFFCNLCFILPLPSHNYLFYYLIKLCLNLISLKVFNCKKKLIIHLVITKFIYFVSKLDTKFLKQVFFLYS